MAIHPPSDIVMDVIKAADPQRADAVTRRLVALGATPATAAAPTDFDSVLASSRGLAQSGTSAISPAVDASNQIAPDDQVDSAKAKKAKIELEAAILNSFVGEMLPKNAPSVYGSGAAGDIWKSVLSDQIAHQIAKSGELGIARRLFATHPLPHFAAKGNAPAATEGGQPNSTQSSSNPLSMPTSASYVDGAFLFLNKAST